MDGARLLREARLEAGLSQQELATRSGTSQEAISAYECGRKDPAASTLVRLLAAAGWQIRRVPAREILTPSRPELRRRGEILAQVVDLAEKLPGKDRGRLAYPPLLSTMAGSEHAPR